MDFDEIIERRGTHSAKWDGMESYCGVSPENGLPMWVADMDFRPPTCVQSALQAYLDHGIYGYFGDDSAYRAAICWWMDNRHGWTLDPRAIFSTHGLVNGTGLCLQAFTKPGDGVVLFTPVYHAFARVIKAAERDVVECELALNDGRYELDFDAYDAQMTGSETMLILCSPHNPGGRVWSRAELQGVADFARRHDLIIVSDEIHCDLVLPGQKHLPMAMVDDTIADRLVMMTATTKTFNLAGGHVGNVIIHDPALRKRFEAVMMANGISPNAFAVHMATAAYSPEGAAWVDALCDYLDGNCRLFDAGINAIPGVRSMRLEGTYLAWVDFSGTGMAPDEVRRRILDDARIAVNFGEVFGAGGDGFQRFNLGTQRARVEEAVKRMTEAFSDLQ
ncbi:pyridoxal phosphate-dependent aminotransferase [Pseudooceanicola sediminis]|uniref:cysteine-S-conjugate beta-lyase n=1 Tax=Pseudooceanicola sediminis TaxID=2211117 RepID=A0A399J415_9RHOB|nr:MalY/PatB family protein [Pseudooceanicola sediminis]KAA2315653.1 pyridoxal phosphate-dependent aminotransferase [Puniceibacterium sp. HSS470]RII40148.1 pyridoxal phosphate-dependent aminotransferase [Pseudooceanicola sediminis]